MKKLFLILALCAAFAVNACLYETENADVRLYAVYIPYIRTVNGTNVSNGATVVATGGGSVSISGGEVLLTLMYRLL